MNLPHRLIQFLFKSFQVIASEEWVKKAKHFLCVTFELNPQQRGP